MSTRIIDALYWVIVVACAVAQLFILRAVFRISPRSAGAGARLSASTADSHPTRDVGREQYNIPAPHRATELVWVVLPVALLVLAFVGAWQVMHPAASLPEFLRQNALPVRQ
ncbi:MAG: hypothetical protein M3Y64_10285 [Gemmatimonadota bacterium]|nr:hypothetical protein [Gemmatimonadota bacterium]